MVIVAAVVVAVIISAVVIVVVAVVVAAAAAASARFYVPPCHIKSLHRCDRISSGPAFEPLPIAATFNLLQRRSFHRGIERPYEFHRAPGWFLQVGSDQPGVRVELVARRVELIQRNIAGQKMREARTHCWQMIL